MNTFELDLKDKNSINDFLKNSGVIEASAGTGKTYTIVKLVKSLILDNNVDPQNILIVTFTDKATTELKDRILKEFETLLTDNSNNYNKNTIREYINRIDDFEIHTIHSFCNKLIKNYPFELNVGFENSIIDDAGIIEEQFYSYLRKEIFEDFQNYEEIFSIFGFDSLNSEKKINSVIDYIKKIRFIFPKIENTISSPTTIKYPADLKKDMVEQYLLEIKNKNTCKSLMNKLTLFFEKDNLLDRLKIIEEIFERYYKNKNQNVINFLFQSGIINYYEEGCNFVNHNINIIASKVYKKVEDFKKKNNYISFDDMIYYVHKKIVNNEDDFIRKIRDIYKYGFIDEFQDTDPIQWDIFKSIFLKGENNKLFIIGDPKQSIYLFRNACVDIFSEAKKDIINKNGKYVILNKNFRSTENLINEYNTIFSSHNYFLTNINYSCVQCGIDENFQYDQKISPINFINITGENSGYEFISFIIEEINNLKDNYGFSYKDIVILVSNRRDGEKINKKLIENGIKSSFYKKKLLFRSQEAINIFYFLDFITDIKDNKKFKKLLLTEFYDIEIEENSFDSNDFFEKEKEKLENLVKKSKPENIITKFFENINLESVIFKKYGNFNYKRIVINYKHIAEKIESIAYSKKLDFHSLKKELLKLIYEENEEELDIDLFRNEGKEEDAVKIMTIHVSKGLEFEVVFDFGALKKINNNKKQYFYSYIDSNGNVKYNVKYIFSTIPPNINENLNVELTEDIESDLIENVELSEKESEQRKRLEEYRRLHYVAITRAKKICYLPIIFSQKEEKKEDPQKMDNRALAEYLYKIIDKNKIKEIKKESKEKKIYNLSEENQNISFNYLKDIDYFTPYKNSFFTIQSYSSLKDFDSNIKKINSLDSNEIDYEKKEDDEFLEYSEELDILFNTEKENNKQLLTSFKNGRVTGTIIHKIMESIEYKTNSENNEKIIKNILNKYFLSDIKKVSNSDIIGINANFNDIKSYNIELVSIDKEGINTNFNDIKCMLDILFEIKFENKFKLSDIEKMKNEINFYFKMGDDYVNGQIDLLFFLDDKYYIIDWKTNKDMDFSIYESQAKIYSYALKEFLKNTIENFNWDNDFGGVFYVYLRHLKDSSNGIIFKKYSEKELEVFYDEIKNKILEYKSNFILFYLSKFDELKL